MSDGLVRMQVLVAGLVDEWRACKGLVMALPSRCVARGKAYELCRLLQPPNTLQ